MPLSNNPSASQDDSIHAPTPSASTPVSPFHRSFHVPRVASFPRSLSSLAHSNDPPTTDSAPTSPGYFPHTNPPSSSSSANMGLRSNEHHKEKPHLDIVLDAPFLTLRGTGPDVEPTTLSGHVALFLTEPTSVKEITLQFRGKAKIPMPASESLIASSTSITYVVCNHDWSFLEGDPRHSRTLKAGRHLFPFHLAIDGSLPSSLTTPSLGGASIAYKLRAHASRPQFHQHALHAVQAVHIVRAFAAEALEYQQTLEIENTWPGKVMYALMLPHKAWPAGDTLAAVLKFSPLRKGVRVDSVETALWETTRVYARSGTQEESRRVCVARHDIVAGRAVEVDWDGSAPGSGRATPERTRGGGVQTMTPQGSRPPSAQGHRPAAPVAGPSSSSGNAAYDEHEHEGAYENMDVVTYITLPIPPSVQAPPPALAHSRSNSHAHTPGGELPSYFTSTHDATSTQNNNTSPSANTNPSTPPTPSHALDPVQISHRVRWSVRIANADGHASELRCSLPVVILDSRVRAEARAAGVPTRRLMMGAVGLGLGERTDDGDTEGWGWGFGRSGEDDGSGRVVFGSGGDADDDDASGTGAGGAGNRDGDTQLPSYTAHVRDRVANMFLPDAATVRVSNPWVGRVGVASPGAGSGAMTPDEAGAAAAAVRSGVATPAEVGQRNHLPPAPGPGTPLDWVNSELLLSLSDAPLRRFGLGPSEASSLPGAAADAGNVTSVSTSTSTHSLPAPPPAPATVQIHASGVRTPPVTPHFVSAGPGPVGASTNFASSRPASRPGSRPTSGHGSRWGSRAGSRAASPERGAGAGGSGIGNGSGRASADAGSRPTSRPASPAFGGFGGLGMAMSAAHAPAPAQPETQPHDAPPAPLFATPLSAVSSASSSAQSQSATTTAAAAHKDHGQEKHGRNLQSLFKATMKPFSALRGHDRERDRGGGSVDLLDGAVPAPLVHSASTSAVLDLRHAVQQPGAVLSTPALHQPQSSNTSASASTGDLVAAETEAATAPALSGPALLHRALTEVPDYSIAARGFIGGVPPLSSAFGLPSYEEAARAGARRGGVQQQVAEEQGEQEEDEEDGEDAGIEMQTRARGGQRS